MDEVKLKKLIKDRVFLRFASNEPDASKELDFMNDIKDCEEKYYEGNSLMLFEAIRRCAQYNIKLPEWIRYELEAGLNKYSGGEVKTFGEAFNITRQKGTHIDSIKKERKLAWPVFNYIHNMNEKEKTPVDEELFNKAGKNFGISGSTARDYYYKVKRQLDSQLQE